jgi:excinuclease ABC subunit B
MRMDLFDVLVGINLLREGLDIPEVGLVAILDADKEGFLRSETALVQTIGRAARNAQGRVIMYADRETDSIRNAVRETNRRRQIQNEYNIANGITPTSIQKKVRDLISISKRVDQDIKDMEKDLESMTKQELNEVVKKITKQMHTAAAELNFELAAQLRDKMIEVKKQLLDF